MSCKKIAEMGCLRSFLTTFVKIWKIWTKKQEDAFYTNLEFGTAGITWLD